MKNIELPIETQKNIRDFILQTQGTQYEQNQLKEFFDSISPSIRKRVAKEIFTKVVIKNKNFNGFFQEMAMEQAGEYM